MNKTCEVEKEILYRYGEMEGFQINDQCWGIYRNHVALFHFFPFDCRFVTLDAADKGACVAALRIAAKIMEDF